MAYEIYENSFNESELFLVGIRAQGTLLSRLLHQELKKIHPIEYHLGEVVLDKKASLESDIVLDIPDTPMEGRSMILVDDVLHSGRTLAYSMKPILELNLKSLQVCVLINRDHKSFPVTPDYVGLSLGTTLDERVEVSLDNKSEELAFLI